MAKEISAEIRGEKVRFFPQKAAYWERRKTLILADLHWGKSEAFQKNGIPVPSTVLRMDLDQLTLLLEQTQAKRIIVLGDLLHAPSVLREELIEEVANWRRSHPLPLLSIRGNHDPKTGQLPESWGIDWVDDCLREDDFCFRHEPKASEDCFTWCGHIHPVLSIGHARDRLRLPCFWIGEELGVLPSYGFFTGGFPIEPAPRDEVFVIAEQEIFSMN